MAKQDDSELTARYADMLSAMGTEQRLRIVRLLLSNIPRGCLSVRSARSWGYPPARCRITSKN